MRAERYHLKSAAARIRGHAIRTGTPEIDQELLEHIPAVDKAIAAAVKMARKYVVVSVPSRPDDNPEHIHLLTKDVLAKRFEDAGCAKLHFSGVNGHLIMMAAIKKEI